MTIFLYQHLKDLVPTTRPHSQLVELGTLQNILISLHLRHGQLINNAKLCQACSTATK